jgi:hypothetical protein
MEGPVATRTGLSVAAIAVAAVLCLAVPAGATAPLGRLTVSNSAPARASAIEVTATGWAPGVVVTFSVSGTDGVLARATTDAAGVAHARVAIPADAARGDQVLSVEGSTARGFPQQITSVLTVGGTERPRAPQRPWVLVFVLAAMAAVLLLAGERMDHRLTVAPIR